jgi:hypothetical protein
VVFGSAKADLVRSIAGGQLFARERGMVQANEMADILDRIKNWPIPERITLARHILESVEARPVVEPPPRRLPLSDVIGILKTDAPPPTDEEVERIIEEERMRKYGG